MPEKKAIVIDTNFLIYCIDQKIDLLSELDRICSFAYEIILPNKVVSELDKISNSGRGKDNMTAKVALEIANRLVAKGRASLREMPGKDADESILMLDKKENIIATIDKELRKKLKNAKLLGIKQFKYLDFA